MYYAIRQLIISPSGHFLAICTDYSVTIAALPDHSRLSEQDQSPLKLKTSQLGPTIHVMPGSLLASVVWHPLADSTTSTDCLVTVTADASVRLWALHRNDPRSFENPELAIDLRKLADGVSCDQDFRPLGFGVNKGFSVDDFDMEVAAACFGGLGTEDEDAWAGMTLWVAMKNGDLYALCPLLPPRWRPSTTSIPSLSTSAVSRMATIADEDVSLDERRAADQQYEWVSEIDNDEPLLTEGSYHESDARLRPMNPSAIPRLQGPFELGLQDEADFDITDVLILPSRLDEEDLYSGEDGYQDTNEGGLPYTAIILAGSDGRIHIALDLEGISGQWLPKKGRSTFSVPMSEPRDLVPLLTIQVRNDTAGSVLSGVVVSLTQDSVHRYTIHASVDNRVTSISLDEWISRLGLEMSPDVEADSRLKTRLETTCQNKMAKVDTIIESRDKLSEPLSAPVIIDDADVGYLVLSYSSSAAYAAKFDQANLQTISLRQTTSFHPSQSLYLQSPHGKDPEPAEPPAVPPSRAVYTPSRAFDMNARAPVDSLRQRLPMPQKRIVTEQPMRLSPALLDIMSSSHRTVSAQTADLETAASELFRRCERLREELLEQVKQMSELADTLHKIQDPKDDDLRPGEEQLTQDRRLERAREKQLQLNKRFDELRRKVGKVGSSKKELSTKEVAWVDEIALIGNKVGVNAAEEELVKESIEARMHTVSAVQRTVPFFLILTNLQVKELSEQLVAEAKRLQETQKQQETEDLTSSRTSMASSSGSRRASGFLVSSRYQKERIAEVMSMVEREGAVIDAVTRRLDALKFDNVM